MAAEPSVPLMLRDSSHLSFVVCFSGYEEVVRIPKGSVFIHIQELNISLNYLGETWSVFHFLNVLIYVKPKNKENEKQNTSKKELSEKDK